MAYRMDHVDLDQAMMNIGPDATATFDNGMSNPTEHASSEALNAATKVDDDDEDEELEDEDDDAAEEEEDDEEDEDEDVEDAAEVEDVDSEY